MKYSMLFLVSLACVQGFTLRGQPQRSPTSSSAVRVLETDKAGPKWIDLPRPRKSSSQLPNLEINTGRLAMDGFFGLLAGEILKGESFGQQIVEAVTFVSSN